MNAIKNKSTDAEKGDFMQMLNGPLGAIGCSAFAK